jgi:transmembrane sensor
MSCRSIGDSGVLDRWSEALEWYVTLRDADKRDLTQAMGRQWQRWYADAENRRVFDDLSRLFAARRDYRLPRLPDAAARADDTYDLTVSIAEWRRMRAARPRRRRHVSARRWWRVIGGLGIAAVAASLILWPPTFKAVRASARPAIYRTAAGRLAEVNLGDGSSIALGPKTILSVAYSAQHRAVRLIRGRAWFSVEHDPGRPFVVSAGDGTITDLGTIFWVARASDRVTVAVAEGKVEVSAPPAMWKRIRRALGLAARPALTPVVVTRGEQISIDDNGALGAITSAGSATAHLGRCRCGPLVFHDESLRNVISTIGRYSSRHFTLESSAGALRVSGLVFRDDTEGWLQSLPTILPVTVTEHGSAVLIRMQRSQPQNAGRQGTDRQAP